jgi:hypothetical protein
MNYELLIAKGIPSRFSPCRMMKQVRSEHDGMPICFYNLFFSAFPAPVPLYFEGVTLNR